jgi:carbamoyltransferase
MSFYQYSMARTILGISAFSHDSACCLWIDGAIRAAAEEERFSRVKHDSAFPIRAVARCLEEAGLTVADIEHVAYFGEPEEKGARQRSMRGTSGVGGSKSQVEYQIRERIGFDGEILYVDHHVAHALCAFHFAGVPEAAFLVADAVGDWSTTSYGTVSGKGWKVLETVRYPHSLGLFYSWITAYLGFEPNGDEYKVMGLAAYGEPAYADRLRSTLRSGTRGQYELDPAYFPISGKKEWPECWMSLLGFPPRAPQEKIRREHENLARSAQLVLEEMLLEKARFLHEETGLESLCLSGGVALNCVANARIRAESPFKRVFVPPAPHDGGGAIGAAVAAEILLEGGLTHARPEPPSSVQALLGPSYPAVYVRRLLESSGIRFRDFSSDEAGLLQHVAERLSHGETAAWFQGRMEFGPRALGARSILADPRRPEMRGRLNEVVKRRELFRPFAPAVLEERAAEFFEPGALSPFMTETRRVLRPEELPAVAHVDTSARVQSVGPECGRFRELLRAFESATGCPALLNTSFNLRDEPIVESPEQALLCFARSGVELLAIEDFVLDRTFLTATFRELCTRWEGILRARAEGRGVEPSELVYAFF